MKWQCRWSLGILNTLWRTGGPTYCGLAGHRSTIDHILVPLSGSECVQKVVTCWKLDRKLQLIPAAQPRDHLPVLVLLCSDDEEDGTGRSSRTRWDFDRIAIALQQGSEERESFWLEQPVKRSRHLQRMIRGSSGSRRRWRRERSLSRTRRLCTPQKRRDMRILKDEISCNDNKDYDNSLVRRLQRWMLIHKNPGQHSIFGFESLGGNFGLRQDERRPRPRSVCLQISRSSPSECKGQGSQTVRTAGKERARSERQALEKLVGATCRGRWDVGKIST